MAEAGRECVEAVERAAKRSCRFCVRAWAMAANGELKVALRVLRDVACLAEVEDTVMNTLLFDVLKLRVMRDTRIVCELAVN